GGAVRVEVGTYDLGAEVGQAHRARAAQAAARADDHGLTAGELGQVLGASHWAVSFAPNRPRRDGRPWTGAEIVPPPGARDASSSPIRRQRSGAALTHGCLRVSTGRLRCCARRRRRRRSGDMAAALRLVTVVDIDDRTVPDEVRDAPILDDPAP